MFGPTFGDEIISAGLGGLPIGWTGAGEVTGRDALTVEQNAKLDQLIAAHDPLIGIKARLKATVDADAERVRLRYITPGVGQSMTYLEKHNQAVAVEAMGQDSANALSEHDRTAQFPTLAASVGIEAATLWDCAQIVVQNYEAWAALSNQIERTRLMSKRSISLASDAAAAQAAYEAITWPQ
jgi:hypothetical protein